MGHYTGLRFEAKLSEFGVGVVHTLVTAPVDDRWEHTAREWDVYWLYAWASTPRAGFIPFGSVNIPDWLDAHWDLVGDGTLWSVCCAVKNHELVIQEFLSSVLPGLIRETTLCEIQDEDGYKSDGYTIVATPLWARVDPQGEGVSEVAYFDTRPW